MIKSAKEWFEEELSGEPLCQDAVIEVIKMIQMEFIEELGLIIRLNEDDFDRGRGKYILKSLLMK